MASTAVFPTTFTSSESGWAGGRVSPRAAWAETAGANSSSEEAGDGATRRSTVEGGPLSRLVTACCPLALRMAPVEDASRLGEFALIFSARLNVVTLLFTIFAAVIVTARFFVGDGCTVTVRFWYMSTFAVALAILLFVFRTGRVSVDAFTKVVVLFIIGCGILHLYIRGPRRFIVISGTLPLLLAFITPVGGGTRLGMACLIAYLANLVVLYVIVTQELYDFWANNHYDDDIGLITIVPGVLIVVVALLVHFLVYQRRVVDLLKIAQAHAMAASRAKDDFLGAMSHELRTPMNAVLGMGQLLEETLSGEEAEHLHVAMSGCRSVIAKFDSILDYIKLQQSVLQLDRRAQPLDEWLQNVSEQVQWEAQAAGRELVVTAGGSAFVQGTRVWIDAQRLGQIVSALLQNALRHSNKVVVFETQLIGAAAVADEDNEHKIHEPRFVELRFAITDDGPGIPSDKRKSIFQPFTQVERGRKRQFDGLGLGLAVASRICESMGGVIELKTQEGRGSTFSVCLPHVRVDVPKVLPAVHDVSGGTVHVRVANAVEHAYLVRGLLERGCHMSYGAAAADVVVTDDAMAAERAAPDTHVLLSWTPLKFARLKARGVACVGKPIVVFDHLVKAISAALRHGVRSLSSSMSQGSMETATARASQHVVLLVDDTPMNNRIIAKFIAHVSPNTVVECVSSAFEALDFLDKRAADVVAVFMDVHVPGMSGVKCVRSIRSRAGHPMQHVFVCAVSADNFVRDECLGAGADDFQAKPLKLTSIKTALRHARRKAQRKQQASAVQVTE